MKFLSLSEGRAEGAAPNSYHGLNLMTGGLAITATLALLKRTVLAHITTIRFIDS